MTNIQWKESTNNVTFQRKVQTFLLQKVTRIEWNWILLEINVQTYMITHCNKHFCFFMHLSILCSPVNCRIAIRSLRRPSFSGASHGKTHSDEWSPSVAAMQSKEVLRSPELCAPPVCAVEAPHASARYPSNRSKMSIQCSSSHYNDKTAKLE